MKITQIQPWINSDEANYIKKIVQKKYLTESKETEKFEKYFQKNFKVSHAIAISNWTCGIFANKETNNKARARCSINFFALKGIKYRKK